MHLAESPDRPVEPVPRLSTPWADVPKGVEAAIESTPGADPRIAAHAEGPVAALVEVLRKPVTVVLANGGRRRWRSAGGAAERVTGDPVLRREDAREDRDRRGKRPRRRGDRPL